MNRRGGLNAGALIAKRVSPKAGATHAASRQEKIIPSINSATLQNKSNNPPQNGSDRQSSDNEVAGSACQILHGHNESGKPTIQLLFRGSELRTAIYDLSFLIELPNLVEPFVDGAVCHLLTTSRRSRITWISSLKRGLCRFLSLQKREAQLTDLDRSLLTAYIKWQDTPEASSNSAAALSINTSRMLVQAGRTLLDALRRHPHWRDAATKAWEDYPKNTHRDTKHLANTREIIPKSYLLDIYKAAMAEVAEIRSRMEEGDRILEEGRTKRARGCVDFSDLSVAFAELVARYGGTLPNDWQQIERRFLQRGVDLREIGGFNTPMGKRGEEPLIEKLKRLKFARDDRAAHGRIHANRRSTYYELMDYQMLASKVLSSFVRHKHPAFPL